MGPRDPKVKLKVKGGALVGGGWENLKARCGDHCGGHKTTTNGGVWDCYLLHRAACCPAALFEGLWGPVEKSQN